VFLTAAPAIDQRRGRDGHDQHGAGGDAADPEPLDPLPPPGRPHAPLPVPGCVVCVRTLQPADPRTRGPAGRGGREARCLPGRSRRQTFEPLRPHPARSRQLPEAVMFTARPARLLALAFALPLTLAGSPEPAGAQGGEEVKNRLGAAPLLLLETAGGEVVRGQPAGWVDDWLLLDTGRRVALGEILRAEALHRRTGDGARWGAI